MRRLFGVDYELYQLLANVSKSMETYTKNIYTIKQNFFTSEMKLSKTNFQQLFLDFCHQLQIHECKTL